MLRRLCPCIVIGLLFGLVPASAWADYSYSRTVTIDHTKVPTTDQSNFPVLFSGTYAYLATTGNGGKVTNANGYDIIFTSDSACTTKLDHEIETYAATTGAVNFWVRVATVSHTTDTVIYLCYGNSAISTSQENVTGVWDSNYKGVWHLKDGTTLSLTDSTSNANTGTNSSTTATTGQIDGGEAFSGSSQYATVAYSSSLAITGDITIEAWVNPTNYITSREVVGKDTSEWASSYLWLFAGSTGLPRLIRGNGSSNSSVTGTTAPSTGVWSHLVVTMSGTTVTHYLNGGTNGSGTLSTTITDNGSSVLIGEDSAGNLLMKGSIDELRISNVARSGSWITAEYNNQSSPSTFYTLGSEAGSATFTPFRRRAQ